MFWCWHVRAEVGCSKEVHDEQSVVDGVGKTAVVDRTQ
jgi:hypothetical protein